MLTKSSIGFRSEALNSLIMLVLFFEAMDVETSGDKRNAKAKYEHAIYVFVHLRYHFDHFCYVCCVSGQLLDFLWCHDSSPVFM